MGRPKSLAAVQRAWESGKLIFLVPQKNPKTDDPSQSDLNGEGTVARITTLEKKDDGTFVVGVKGLERKKVLGLVRSTSLTSVRLQAPLASK